MATSIGETLQEHRRAARLTLRQLAERAGVSNPYLSQIERGLRRPSADVLARLAAALEISSDALSARAEGLEPVEPAAPSGTVLAAVAADQALTPRQRRILVDLYQTFVRDTARTTAAAGDPAAAPTPTKERP
jgi:transcriptional regulator with XRE-family HTH domain